MFDAKVVQVIVTELAVRGKGAEGEPLRRIRQFWTLNGELLAEVDPLTEPAKYGVAL